MMSSVGTMFGLSRNPDKYEARAIEYDKKGNPAKAQKNREKAARLRQAQLNSGNNSSNPSARGDSAFTNPLWSPERYDQKAQKWEAKGNLAKAQKNREKAARLRAEQGTSQYNPQFTRTTPVQNYGTSSAALNTPLPQTVPPPIVETHMHPTIVEQTTRPEKIVEVQPVIHRDVDHTQVHLIQQHSYQTAPPLGPGVITKPTIVQETVHEHIINEVQPVLHREVPVPVLEQVQRHTTEHLVAPTTIIKEVQEMNQTRPAMAAGGPPPPPLPNNGHHL